MKVHEIMEELKVQIRANVMSDQNQDGLLTARDEQYMRCFEFDYEGLEALLRRDEDYWINGISTVKEKANEMQDEVKQFLAQQAIALSKILEKTKPNNKV